MAGGVVLYVDDEWTNRTVFEKTFGGRFEVVTVASGQEALEKMRAGPVAVLVTDQRMPGMTGNELLEQTKKEFPATVRMVVTAYSDEEPILRAVNQGLVTRYIVKPWDKKELEEALAWGVEAWERASDKSEIALRLIHAERLITLGTIADRIFHDLNQRVAAALKYNSERLTELSASARALETLVEERGEGLSPEDARNLSDLAEELPEIAEELSYEGQYVLDLVQSYNQILRNVPRESQPPADPRRVIDFTLSVFRTMKTDHLELLYQGPESLPRVDMTTTELAQVLVNLVSNAVQALPSKPAIHAGAPLGKIVVSAREDGARVRFSVADDGKGMEPEVKELAGKMFFSTKPEGAGIGLAQVKRLVAAARGEMKIVSAPGAGTRIDFALPKAA